MERLPPQNIEAEAAVLGSILIDPQALSVVAELLHADDFYRDGHRVLFQAALDLYGHGQPADLVTLTDAIERQGKLEQIGGADYITMLVNVVPTSANVEYYAQIVARTSILRKLIHAAGQIAALAYTAEDATVALDKAEQLIFAISQNVQRADFEHIRDILNAYYDKLDQLHNHRGDIVGIPTGFSDLDKMTGGLQRSDLIILAARPSIGKTSFALSMAHNAAVKFGASMALFSLEMSKEQLAQRLLSMDAGIDQQRLRTGYISDADDEWTRISLAMGRLSESNIYIDDTAGITMIEMRSKARRLMAERGFDVLMVDYLQLMQGTGSKGDGNRQQEISEISRGLKGLARELNVPVLALSQLSRAVESRQSKVPQLSDLRESGCITGDALVYLPDSGRYERMDALVGRSGFNVLALNTTTWKAEPRPVTRAFATGCKPVFRMTTRLGRTIRATANHKFLTIHGWQRLDELAPDMRVAVPRTLPSPTEQTMTDAELALLGHLIGDGCTLPRQPIHYTTNDITLAEIVADLAVQVFGAAVTPRINRERTWYQVYLAATDHLGPGKRSPVAVWLEALGVFGLRSYEKRVPDKVFMQPASAIACFLRHLWSTDGCINLSEGVKHYANIYYASSSPALARDVQSLLLRLSINATLTRHSQGDKGRDQFHVTVSGKEDSMLFLSLVGGLGQLKTAHHAAIHGYLSERVANTNRDVVPREVWRMHVVPAMTNASLTSREMQAALGMQYCGTALYKSNISRNRAATVAAIVQSPELANLAQSDVYWDSIISIEPDGEEDVYDLTVDNHHNFFVNNIVSHNSIEQDADIVMFIYRDEIYNPETDRPNIADIIVAKHRNGPVGTISLYFQPNQTRFRDLELQRVEDL
jgi:replicative DNA helicase